MEKENHKHIKNNNNFSNDFLKDFRLLHTKPYDVNKPGIGWTYSKKTLERFHIPVAYKNPNENGSEGPKHYKLKSLVHGYIYENYYLENECKFLVTTELEQKNNPFFSYIDGKIPVFFTLDVCVIRENDHQVFDIEIDGPEHYTRRGLMKADIRDEWLKDRYGIITYRIDRNDEEPNYKEIDELLTKSPTVENPRKHKKNIIS